MAKNRRTLSNWLTNKYLLIIRNEENFEEKTSFTFTVSKLIVFSVLVLGICFTISYFFITTILSQWLDPRYSQYQLNEKIITLSSAVDSLSWEVEKKDRFILSFKKMLQGGDSSVVVADSLLASGDASGTPGIETEKIAPVDSQFRKDFKDKNVYPASMKGSQSLSGGRELRNIFLFPPIDGIITQQYDPEGKHYGIDIVARENEAIKSVSDGTVIISSWTEEAGYVLAVQHPSNLISVYKHNSALLKKVGDFVEEGEIVAILGNTGKLTTGPHLHFELWYNGNPVNPQDYITF